MSPSQLVITALPGIPHVSAGNDLASLVVDGLTRAAIEPQPNDVIVLAQKIVSKAEGRSVALSDVVPSARAMKLAEAVQKDPRLVELILLEAAEVMRVRPNILIVRHRLGFVLANAGIDQSNIDHANGECALLLPRDPDGTAAQLREKLQSRYEGVDMAVLIIDSLGRAWRNGTVGQCLGASGLPALLDLRGEPDTFGRKLRTSELGLADEIAAAASLAMGQAGEATPIVHLRGVPYGRRDGTARELLRPREMDLFP